MQYYSIHKTGLAAKKKRCRPRPNLAYEVEDNPRARALKLLDSHEFTEGKERLSDQVTDPGHATAIAQRMTLTAQLEMRKFRKIDERITNLFE
jgi:hypothetical protein